MKQIIQFLAINSIIAIHNKRKLPTGFKDDTFGIHKFLLLFLIQGCIHVSSRNLFTNIFWLTPNIFYFESQCLPKH